MPFDLGGGWGLDVGVANGEARLSRDLFSIPSYGPAQSLSLSYSSLEAGAAGRFGVGWSSNLTQYLSYDVANAVTTWHRADGGRVPFGLVSGAWTPLAGHHETMSVSGGEVAITAKDQTAYVFDGASGALKRIVNRFGKALTVSWSTGGATVADASGRGPASGQTYNIVYDSANARISAFTDYAGRTWGFGYSGTGSSSMLTSVTDPAGAVTTLGYTSSRLTSVSRQRSRVSGGPETLAWSVAYDGSGRVQSVTDPIDAAYASPDRNTFAYASSTTTVGILRTYGSNPAYNTSTYQLDGLGRVTQATDPEGYTTKWNSYDADGNPASVDRPVGDGTAWARTSYSYDDRGNVLSETAHTDASTTVTTAYSYSAANDVLTRSDADNDAAVKTVTKYAYDAAGHLASMDVNCTSAGTTPPADASQCTGGGTQDGATNLLTRYSYTSSDQLAFEQDPTGVVTMHVYDAYGDETQTVRNCTSSGTAAPSPFDSCTAAGTHDWQTNVTTNSTFDAGTRDGRAGLPATTADALGRQTAYSYDVLGRQLTEILPWAAGDTTVPGTLQCTTYDELGNTLAETQTWTVGTDAPPADCGANHGSTVRTATHAYDLVNRETNATDPAGAATATSYDAAGDAVATTAGGVTTARAFDGLGRAISETTDGGTTQTAHLFDAAGNEVEADAATGEAVRHAYDYRGLALTDVADPDGSAATTSHAYDLLGRETSTTDPTGAATTRTFDRAGRQVSETTAAGTTTTVSDRAGNAVAVKILDGSVTATAYDPLGRATQSIANCTDTGTTQPAAGAACAGAGTHNDTTNLVTATLYDAAGTTVAATDAKGVSSRTVPNARGLAETSIANCTDTGTTPTADPRDCTGEAVLATRNATTNVATTTSYDGSGAATGTTVAVGTGAEATTLTAFDAAGRTVAVRDPMGTVTRDVYNGLGQLTDTYVNCTTTGITIPADWAACTGGGTADGTFNLHTSYAYDSNGNRVSETAPNGRVTRYEYDASGRLARQYDNYEDGNWTSADPTADVPTATYYDAAGRAAAVVRLGGADGATPVNTRTVYDDAGRVTATIANCTDAQPGQPPEACTGSGIHDGVTNVEIDYAYDDSGSQVKVTAPDPSAFASGTGTMATRYAYDSAGRLCRVVEASSSTDAQWAALAHPCSDAISGTATANLSTLYTYDPAGNLATATDADGHTTAYTYDAAGRLLTTTDPDSGVLVYAYDAAGNRVRQESRSDPPYTPSVTWTYDGAGRVLSRTADGATTSYEYDANGNRTCAGTGADCATAPDRITATYDRLNRVLSTADAADPADATSYTYSLASPTWSDPSGDYAATLDRFDRATGITDPLGGAFSWSYRADGQPSALGQPNGNSTAYGYDALGRQASRATAHGSTARAAYAWTRNAAGQVLSESSNVATDPTNGTRAFTYNVLGRITGFTDGTRTTAYAWDAALNRTSVQTTGSASVSTAFDAANRPTAQNGVAGAFTADADGRVTSRPNPDGTAYQRFTWDRLGRLTSVLPPSGSTPVATYAYDPLDRLRLADYGGGSRVRFRYTGMTTSIAQEVDDATGSVTRSVGNGWTGEHLEDWTGTGSNLRVYGTNAHGDVTWTAGSSGSVMGTVRYDPYGTATSVTGSVPDFRFQGSWADDTTKLSWVVTRWYAPAQGTFISEDSLLGEPRDPDSRHLYAYGEGDPVAHWDLIGQDCGGAAANIHNPWDVVGTVGQCLLDAGGAAVGAVSTGAEAVSSGVVALLLVVAVAFQGDTVRPQPKTLPLPQPRTLPLPPLTSADRARIIRTLVKWIARTITIAEVIRLTVSGGCWAIGEGQQRVDRFALGHRPRCAVMPTLPARVVKAIGHNLMLRLNEAWARGQMLFKRWLYDLGPDGRAVPSDFYRMEVRVTRNYHFVTHLPGWGLAASQRSRVL